MNTFKITTLSGNKHFENKQIISLGLPISKNGFDMSDLHRRINVLDTMQQIQDIHVQRMDIINKGGDIMDCLRDIYQLKPMEPIHVEFPNKQISKQQSSHQNCLKAAMMKSAMATIKKQKFGVSVDGDASTFENWPGLPSCTLVQIPKKISAKDQFAKKIKQRMEKKELIIDGDSLIWRIPENKKIKITTNVDTTKVDTTKLPNEDGPSTSGLQAGTPQKVVII